jgi:hypothetical protein
MKCPRLRTAEDVFRVTRPSDIYGIEKYLKKVDYAGQGLDQSISYLMQGCPSTNTLREWKAKMNFKIIAKIMVIPFFFVLYGFDAGKACRVLPPRLFLVIINGSDNGLRLTSPFLQTASG